MTEQRPDGLRLASELACLRIERGETVCLTVSGLSMGRTLSPAGEVSARRCERPLRVGDIVLIRLAGELVAHRIIAAPSAGTVITKGDTCLHPDPPIANTDVIAEIIAVQRGGRPFRPWHWCPPLSRIIGTLSRLEAAFYPYLVYPLRPLYRFIRLAGMRRHYRERDAGNDEC